MSMELTCRTMKSEKTKRLRLSALFITDPAAYGSSAQLAPEPPDCRRPKRCVNLGKRGNSMRDQMQHLRLKIACSAAIAAMLALSGSAEAITSTSPLSRPPPPQTYTCSCACRAESGNEVLISNQTISSSVPCSSLKRADMHRHGGIAHRQRTMGRLLLAT